MTSNIKSYYSSKGYRVFILIAALANFGFGLIRLLCGFFIYDEYLFPIANSLIYCIIGTFFLFLYAKSKHLPVAQGGSGWIIIKQGARNRGFLRAQSRVKGIKITKSEVDHIHNGIFSLRTCTVDQYRYLLYGLAEPQRKDLIHRLLSI